MISTALIEVNSAKSIGRRFAHQKWFVLFSSLEIFGLLTRNDLYSTTMSFVPCSEELNGTELPGVSSPGVVHNKNKDEYNIKFFYLF